MKKVNCSNRDYQVLKSYTIMIRHLVLLLFALIGRVRCHSWIACSDYMEKNGGDWDPDKCRGFPRDASQFANKNNFGLDRGFDYKPADGSSGCKTTYSASSYSEEYPKAVYYPGQQVILAHPMKNHGADPGCTNSHIPDKANKIYRGKVNTDRDKLFGYYRKFLVADLGVSPTGNGAAVDKYPKLGYQNAPNFCKDTDKSMGTYSFNVPRNLAPGEYTFVWRWSFNSLQDIYATCFDVIIAPNKRERDNALQGRGAGLYIACGGTTSDGSSGSSTGCDDVNIPRPPTETLPAVRPGGPNPPPRPRPRPTLPSNSKPAPVNAYQLTGEIKLPKAGNGIMRRFLSVHFDCPGDVIFWNARLILAHNHEDRKRRKRHAAVHFELLQEESDHIQSGKIFFKAQFESPCNAAANPPIVKLKMDE